VIGSLLVTVNTRSSHLNTRKITLTESPIYINDTLYRPLTCRKFQVEIGTLPELTETAESWSKLDEEWCFARIDSPFGWGLCEPSRELQVYYIVPGSLPSISDLIEFGASGIFERASILKGDVESCIDALLLAYLQHSPRLPLVSFLPTLLRSGFI
jgi:hypothetical protein